MNRSDPVNRRCFRDGRNLVATTVAVAMLVAAGCSCYSSNTNSSNGNAKDDVHVSKGNGAKPVDNGSRIEPKVAIPIPDVPEQALHKPEIQLSAADQKTCLVDVGKALPPFTLPSLDGRPYMLADLLGPKLTVVVFWDAKNLFGEEQISRLHKEVVEPFSQFGVKVVAVNVGDSVETAKEVVDQYDIAFPCLSDSDGAVFSKVATEFLPRTYVLDARGEILWFDIGYSQNTERELPNALNYYLKRSADVPSEQGAAGS